MAESTNSVPTSQPWDGALYGSAPSYSNTPVTGVFTGQGNTEAGFDAGGSDLPMADASFTYTPGPRYAPIATLAANDVTEPGQPVVTSDAGGGGTAVPEFMLPTTVATPNGSYTIPPEVVGYGTVYGGGIEQHYADVTSLSGESWFADPMERNYAQASGQMFANAPSVSPATEALAAGTQGVFNDPWSRSPAERAATALPEELQRLQAVLSRPSGPQLVTGHGDADRSAAFNRYISAVQGQPIGGLFATGAFLLTGDPKPAGMIADATEPLDSMWAPGSTRGSRSSASIRRRGSTDALENLVRNKFPDEALDPKGKIYGVANSVDGRVVIDRPSLPRDVDFVVTSDGQLVIGQKHTTLAENADVLAAGQMKLSGQGRIRLIDNLSGHYQPTVADGLRVPTLLESLGYDMSGAYLKLYDFTTDVNGFVTGRNLVVNRQIP
ncbi:hypothetical protein [Ralstonia syzygii]|uniref:Uncharacterized protein n=1 Tax=Ralstonia syzygii R24 TaxID=907261 RepID=G3A755_9RALS|nr:hypothetical protein [Ralstonia syzygii]CCA86318.1 hypothetical protein RALSY_40536 [Ralstonia syzygii R24]